MSDLHALDPTKVNTAKEVLDKFTKNIGRGDNFSAIPYTELMVNLNTYVSEHPIVDRELFKYMMNQAVQWAREVAHNAGKQGQESITQINDIIQNQVDKRMMPKVYEMVMQHMRNKGVPIPTSGNGDIQARKRPREERYTSNHIAGHKKRKVEGQAHKVKTALTDDEFRQLIENYKISSLDNPTGRKSYSDAFRDNQRDYITGNKKAKGEKPDYNGTTPQWLLPYKNAYSQGTHKYKKKTGHL